MVVACLEVLVLAWYMTELERDGSRMRLVELAHCLVVEVVVLQEKE